MLMKHLAGLDIKLCGCRTWEREREKISLLTTRLHSAVSSSLATHEEHHDGDVVGIDSDGEVDGDDDGKDDGWVGIDGDG